MNTIPLFTELRLMSGRTIRVNFNWVQSVIQREDETSGKVCTRMFFNNGTDFIDLVNTPDEIDALIWEKLKAWEKFLAKGSVSLESSDN